MRSIRQVRLKSTQVHSPASSRERAAAIASVRSAFPDRLFARGNRNAPRFGEQGRQEAAPLAPSSEEAPLSSGERRSDWDRCFQESPADLHAKFRHGALEIGVRAISDALEAVSLSPADVGYMLCVTSTGFMVPGLVRFSRELGLTASSCGRTSFEWDATPG